MIYDVTITRPDLMAVFDLKGEAGALARWGAGVLPEFPATPQRYDSMGGADLMWLGRRLWYLRAPIAQEPALLAALRPDAAPVGISIVRLSDSLSFFQVTGPDVAEVMAVASPIDLHPSVFPGNGAALTEAFGIKALIVAVAGGFQIGVDRSFAPMVADYLARAVAS
jgi:sarcosine oxidase subunit gamma